MLERTKVVEGDITQLDLDAIVNAANESLAPGAGVCGAIHRASGPELAVACARIVAGVPPVTAIAFVNKLSARVKNTAFGCDGPLSITAAHMFSPSRRLA